MAVCASGKYIAIRIRAWIAVGLSCLHDEARRDSERLLRNGKRRVYSLDHRLTSKVDGEDENRVGVVRRL